MPMIGSKTYLYNMLGEHLMHTEQLLREVENAFPFVPKPTGDGLSFHKDDCLQCKFLRNDLAKYDKPEIAVLSSAVNHQDQ